MIDLATLTGAIIVALGDRYAGLFSNSDRLSKKLLESSNETKELIWRLPMDSKFDKLLDCSVADMKNITGTRGAGSITAAQFIKRFVGDVDWAHLDIAGVTWAKRGTEFSRPGGTGFGVRLLDHFVKIIMNDNPNALQINFYFIKSNFKEILTKLCEKLLNESHKSNFCVE